MSEPVLPGSVGARRPGTRVIRRERRRAEHITLTPYVQRSRPPPPALILTLSFVVAIAIGTILLILPIASATGSWTAPHVALFTATSAVCVTGLVLVDTSTHWSSTGQLIILVLIQFGGLGFMTGASLVFMVLGRRLSLRERLLMREEVGSSAIGDVGWFVRRVAVMTFAIEAVGATILFVRFLAERPPGEALWYAIFHAISAFNNAGFDLFGGFRSVTIYQTDPVVLLSLAGLIILGGLSYITLADVARARSFARLALDSKVVLTTSVALWGVGLLAFLGAETNNSETLLPLDWPTRLLNAFFQSVTARTAGFNNVDVSKLTEQSLFLIIGLMFIGAAPASTGGGIRLTTFSVLFFAIVSTVQGNAEVRAFRRTIAPATVNRALSIALLSVALIFVVAYILTVTEKAPFLHLLFEATSAFATVGLSTGVTPTLSLPGTLLITATMFAGRLGPLTLAVVLARNVVASRIHYAEEQIRVG